MSSRNDRFAVFFAPDSGSALWQEGSRWLGWNAATGKASAQPACDGIDPALVFESTEAPRFYGFHATLKPPFHLRDGADENDLQQAVAAFAAARPAFDAPPPRVGRLGRFLALVLSRPSVEMDALAAACVRDLDDWRGALSDADLARRRAVGLTDRQEDYLQTWGYPYVLDEFRFHMSLTGSIESDTLRDRIAAALTARFEPYGAAPMRVDAVCLFHQEDRHTPFRIMRRFALAGDGEAA